MLTKRNLVINTIIKINNFCSPGGGPPPQGNGGLNKYLGLSKGLNVVSVHGAGLGANPGTLLCNRFKRGGSYDFFFAGSLKQKKGAPIRCLHTRKAAFTPPINGGSSLTRRGNF